jgi:hypothetical protein
MPSLAELDDDSANHDYLREEAKRCDECFGRQSFQLLQPSDLDISTIH